MIKLKKLPPLKKCPCCGGDADYIVEQPTYFANYGYLTVVCEACGIRTNTISINLNGEAELENVRSFNEMVKAWNARTKGE